MARDFITIEDTPSMAAWSESFRIELLKLGDNIADQMIAIHPRIIYRLQHEGLDENSRFPFASSSARKAADAIIAPGKRAADFLNSAAVTIKAFDGAWRRLYSEPIQVAREMRKSGSDRAMGD
jgi:hypothetical protein